MDVTDVILRDHTWFRAQFVALYDLRSDDPSAQADVAAIEAIWTPLAARLDVHAAAEEELFYPELLRLGEEDPAEETLDAIGDHNDIRDGVHDAARHPTASQEWWDAVEATREANDEHMAEEEREGIADFRLNAPAELREELGERLEAFLDGHPTTEGVRTSDLDPERYVDEIEAGLTPDGPRGSLGIGSLKTAPETTKDDA